MHGLVLPDWIALLLRQRSSDPQQLLLYHTRESFLRHKTSILKLLSQLLKTCSSTPSPSHLQSFILLPNAAGTSPSSDLLILLNIDLCSFVPLLSSLLRVAVQTHPTRAPSLPLFFWCSSYTTWIFYCGRTPRQSVKHAALARCFSSRRAWSQKIPGSLCRLFLTTNVSQCSTSTQPAPASVRSEFLPGDQCEVALVLVQRARDDISGTLDGKRSTPCSQTNTNPHQVQTAFLAVCIDALGASGSCSNSRIGALPYNSPTTQGLRRKQISLSSSPNSRHGRIRQDYS